MVTSNASSFSLFPLPHKKELVNVDYTCIQHLLCARPGAGCCKLVKHNLLLKEFTDLVEETQETEPLSSGIDAVTRERRCAWGGAHQGSGSFSDAA